MDILPPRYEYEDEEHVSPRIVESRPTGSPAFRRRSPAWGAASRSKRAERLVVSGIALLLAIQFKCWDALQKYDRDGDAEFERPLAPRGGSGAHARPTRVVPRILAMEPPSADDDLPAGPPSGRGGDRGPTAWDHGGVLHRTTFELDSVPSDPPNITAAWYAPAADRYVDGDDRDACEPMHAYQLMSFPNCNAFHELDLSRLRFINSGGSRSAFELREAIDGREGRFVYKSVRYKKEIDGKLVEEQRKDGLILERTSGSRFIPDLYGYCSLVRQRPATPIDVVSCNGATSVTCHVNFRCQMV